MELKLSLHRYFHLPLVSEKNNNFNLVAVVRLYIILISTTVMLQFKGVSFATKQVSSCTSLLSDVRRAQWRAFKLPWISISSHGGRTTPLGHLMNSSKHILCLSYVAALLIIYTHSSTTVCNINVGKMKESPRVTPS